MKYIDINVKKFEDFRAVRIYISAFLASKLCGIVNGYQRFEGASYFRLEVAQFCYNYDIKDGRWG